MLYNISLLLIYLIFKKECIFIYLAAPDLSCGARILDPFVECGVFSLLHADMWTCLSRSMWNLVPWPGIKLKLSALGTWSLSHWTTREVPIIYFTNRSLWLLIPHPYLAPPTTVSPPVTTSIFKIYHWFFFYLVTWFLNFVPTCFPLRHFLGWQCLYWNNCWTVNWRQRACLCCPPLFY